MKTALRVLLTSSISCLALHSVAMAQTAAEPAKADTATKAPEDTVIVVTAQRKIEKVTEVPISIAVADSAQLERQQVNSVNDLNRITPSLEVMSAPGQNTGGGGMVRGVGTQTTAAGASASVGIVVDQVSQGNANISDLFDVSRVEVLKGPQGTLFGLTTSAGVINITTNAPDMRGFYGRVRAELSDAGTAGSEFGNQVVQGMVNIPLADNAALRVSALANLRQGVDYNTYNDKYVANDHYGARARLLWKPNSDVTVNLIGDYYASRSTFSGDFLTYVAAPADITTALASCDVTPGVGNQKFCTSLNSANRSRNYGTSLQVDWNVGDLTLTSITAGRKTETEPTALGTVVRADVLPTQLYSGPTNGGEGSLFSQEFRIASPSTDRLEYTAGLFFSREQSVATPSPFAIDVTVAPGVIIPVAYDPGSDNKIHSSSAAAFGQATWHVNDKLRLIGGARYTEAKLQLATTPVGGAQRIEHLDSNVWSYRLGAQYDFDRRTMAYATVSRGFKNGQIAIPTGLPPVILKPEIPMSYELGLKKTLFTSWVLDANAFYQKFDNFQAQACGVDGNTAQLLCTQTNLPDILSRGAEVSVFGRINRNLNISTGYILAKTTYPDNFLGNDGTDIGGTQLAYAPEQKFTFSGEYTHNINGRANGFAALDAVWKSKIRYQQTSSDDTTMKAHWTVGGRIGAHFADDKYTIALFARNLFNVHEPAFFLSSGEELLALYGPNSFRQVGLSLDAKF